MGWTYAGLLLTTRAMTGCNAYQFNSLTSVFFMSINVDIWHTHVTHTESQNYVTIIIDPIALDRNEFHLLNAKWERIKRSKSITNSYVTLPIFIVIWMEKRRINSNIKIWIPIHLNQIDVKMLEIYILAFQPFTVY